ncbi:phage protein Gp27 family protein [Rheinheimera gaetbuli]
MARKSSLDTLPDVVKAYIQGKLAENKLTLDELIANLQQQFPEEAAAGELPSRSAVGRYGQKLERRLAAIRASTEAAKIIRDQAGDKEDARSEALTAMIQSELFESIMNLQDVSNEDMTPAERVGLLADAAKNIATLTRSSVTLKKYQVEAEERGRKLLLEEQKARLSAMETKGGVTDETRAAIREALGIAS